MYEVIQIRVVICFNAIRFDHVPVFGIGRDEASTGGWWFRFIGVLDVRGDVWGHVVVKKVGIVKAGVDVIVECGDEALDGRVGCIGCHNMLDSGRGDDLARFGKDPIAEVTTDTVRDTEPTTETPRGGSSIISRNMIPDKVVKGKIEPF